MGRFFSFAAPLDGDVLEIADARLGADVAAADRQRMAAVVRAISKLSTNLEEPLILCTVDGLSQADASRVLGISEKAVETCIGRARLWLLENLGDA